MYFHLRIASATKKICQLLISQELAKDFNGSPTEYTGYLYGCCLFCKDIGQSFISSKCGSKNLYAFNCSFHATLIIASIQFLLLILNGKCCLDSSRQGILFNLDDHRANLYLFQLVSSFQYFFV